MGWFSNSGPAINSRLEGNNTIWFSRCVCGDTHEHKRKSSVESQVKKCQKSREEKVEKEKAKARKEALEAKHEERKKRAEREERAEAERHKKEAERLRNQMLKTQRQLKRDAKGKKCPWCRSQPCKGTKPECAKLKASRLQSSMNMDMSDPATFDEQLAWYNKHLR